MDTKTLLAFLLALPGANVKLANDLALKKIRNKLASFKNAEITPKDWENLEAKLKTLLETKKYAALNQLYQKIQAELADINITPNFLPTQAELEAEKPANRRIGKSDLPPSKINIDSHEVINIGVVILSHQNPAKTANKLLWRLRVWLKRQRKSEPTPTENSSQEGTTGNG